MTDISWKKEYCTGHIKLDETNKDLFKCICDLNNEQEIKNTSDALDQIIKYIKEHFETELIHMQSINYPDIRAHQQEHDIFVDTALSMTLLLYENSLTPAIIISFIRHWFDSHILHKDQEISKYEHSLSLKRENKRNSSVKA